MCFRKILIVVFVFLLMGVSESYAGKVVNCILKSNDSKRMLRYKNFYDDIVRNYSNKEICEDLRPYQNFPSIQTLCKDSKYNAINDELENRKLSCSFDNETYYFLKRIP